MSAELLTPATSDLFGISNHDKMMAAQRELDMRRRVYPGRVAEGKMTQEAAGRQIALMQAIVDDYALIAATDAPVVTCRPLRCKLGATPVLMVDTSVDRPRDRPRIIDMALPLDVYTSTEIVRALLPWVALNAGDNWNRVVVTFEQASAGRAGA